MADINEQLPPYMLNSQPAQQLQMQSQQQQPQAQQQGLDSEGFAPITDAQTAALLKPQQPASGQQLAQQPASGQQAPGQEALPPYMQATGGQAQDQGQGQPTFEEAAKQIPDYDLTDYLAKVVGKVAPYIMPVEGFAGAVAGTAASGLARTIGEALQNPITRNAVVGAVTGEAGAVSDAAQGENAHWIADPVVGAVGGAALGGAAKGVHSLLNRAGQVTPEIQAVESLGAKHDVPVYTTDVVPPNTSVGKHARRFVEELPIIGTGGMRRGQQKAREELAEAVKKHFEDIGYSPGALVDNVILKDKTIRKRANRKYRQIVKAVGDKPISSQNTIGKINQKMKELTTTPGGVLRQSVDTATVNKLQAISNDIKADPSFENLQQIRRNFRETIRGNDQYWPDSTKRMADDIYDTMGADLKDGVEVHLGKPGRTKWEVANQALALEVKKVKGAVMKKVFNAGEATPEIAEKLLTSTKDSDQEALYNALSPKGRATAMSGIIHGVVDKATSNDGVLNPTGLLNGLKAQKDALSVFGSKGDLAYLDGVAKILSATRRAQEAAAAPETGAKVVPFAALAGMLHPVSASAVIASSILGRLYESGVTRNLIMKIGKTDVNSSKFSNLMTQFDRRFSKSEPSGQPGVAVQRAQTPEQSAIDWAQESGARATAGDQGFQSQSMAGQAGTQAPQMTTPEYARQTAGQAAAAQPAAPQPVAATPEAMTRGIRNNNPLNIRSNHHNMWKGKKADVDGFVQFSSPELGIRAAAKTLKSYRKKGLTTITGIINRFAPGSENNTEAYIHSIEQMIGVNRNVPLKTSDYPKLIKAMSMIESKMHLSEDAIRNIWNKS